MLLSIDRKILINIGESLNKIEYMEELSDILNKLFYLLKPINISLNNLSKDILEKLNNIDNNLIKYSNNISKSKYCGELIISLLNENDDDQLIIIKYLNNILYDYIKPRNRKIFNYIDGKEILAGGVIIYKFENNQIKLLLITKNNKLEDLGGKSDFKDNTYFDMIIREASEESNDKINTFSLYERLEASEHIIYIDVAKYILYFIEASGSEKNLISSDFNNYEIYGNIKRTINWVTSKDFFSSDVNIRLNNDLVKNKIIELEQSILK